MGCGREPIWLYITTQHAWRWRYFLLLSFAALPYVTRRGGLSFSFLFFSAISLRISTVGPFRRRQTWQPASCIS